MFYIQILIVKNIFECLNVYITIELCKVSCKFNGLRANFYAVLGISTTGDSAFLHESVQAFWCIEFSERVKIEQISLNCRSRSYEI